MKLVYYICTITIKNKGMNTESGITGKKQHMNDTKIMWSETKQAVVIKNASVDSSCNIHSNNQINMNDFIKQYKSNPSVCCGKCINRMNVLIERAKSLKNRKQK
jgi:hypothetical protein